jgi:hypothetical protein
MERYVLSSCPILEILKYLSINIYYPFIKGDIIPSIQVLLNCGTAGSCGGGDIHAVFRWIYLNGIPDATCQPYRAVDGNCSLQGTYFSGSVLLM